MFIYQESLARDLTQRLISKSFISSRVPYVAASRYMSSSTLSVSSFNGSEGVQLLLKQTVIRFYISKQIVRNS